MSTLGRHRDSVEQILLRSATLKSHEAPEPSGSRRRGPAPSEPGGAAGSSGSDSHATSGEISSSRGPAFTHRSREPGPIQALLQVPLFAKILIANAAIIVLGAAAGTWITSAFVRANPGSSALELVGLLAIIAVVLSLGVNAIILSLALSPLRDLEDAATRIREGEVDARARLSPLADWRLERLILTFNAMLDALSAYRERLRAAVQRALRAQEEERKRLSRELHDDTAQRLAALRIRLHMLGRAEDPDARAAVLDEVRKEVAEIVESIRRFAHGLRPPALDELGLVPALRTHVHTLRQAHGLDVRIDAEAIDGLLPGEAELALYRIVQEALSNVVRHAGATEARVTIQHEPGSIVATVTDDGRGFKLEPRESGPGGGLGLEGMRERASYAAGHLEIESEPGRGTTVRVRVPVDETDA